MRLRREMRENLPMQRAPSRRTAALLSVVIPALCGAASAAAYNFPKAPSVSPEVAPPGEPRTQRGEAEVWNCFSRPPENARVDRHLPKLVCVAGASVALVIQSDGRPLFEGGARRAGTPHASRALIAGAIDARRIAPNGDALYGTPAGQGYHVWTVIERTPEDPGGDSSATTVEFDVDATGKPLPNSFKVYGEVACTAPACQGALSPSRVDFAAEAPGARRLQTRRDTAPKG